MIDLARGGLAAVGALTLALSLWRWITPSPRLTLDDQLDADLAVALVGLLLIAGAIALPAFPF